MGWSKEPVVFSKHARSRMADRGICLSEEAMDRLGLAMDALDGKRGKTALVLLDQAVILVSVKNMTVITLIDWAAARGNLFTQIDCVVIA